MKPILCSVSLLVGVLICAAPHASGQIQSAGGLDQGTSTNGGISGNSAPTGAGPVDRTWAGPGDTVNPFGGRPVDAGSSGGGVVVPGTNPGINPSPLASPLQGASPTAPTVAGTPIGPALLPDNSLWGVWWIHNQDPYLALKKAIHRQELVSGSDDFFLGEGQTYSLPGDLRPASGLVYESVVPALLGVLKQGRSPRLQAETLIALGRIGPPPAEADYEVDAETMRAALIDYLDHPSIVVADTATISLGILGSERSVFLLADMLEDRPAGRAAVGNNPVSVRQRAFAAYALGLIGERSEREDVRRFIVHKLVGELDRWSSGPYDLPIACVAALGVVPIDPIDGWVAPEDGASPTQCRQAQIAWLLEFLGDRSRKFLVRAHVPTALARLTDDLPGSAPERVLVAEALIDALGRRSRAQREIQQSCALALGTIGDSDQDTIDREIRRTLLRVSTEVGDQTVRHFAMISLAQVAARPGTGSGEPLSATQEVYPELIAWLMRGRTPARPWAALSLGVHGRHLADVRAVPSADSSEALSESLADTRSTLEAGAYAIGAGLQGASSAAPRLLELHDQGGVDVNRGYAAVGLGLMGASQAKDTLRATVRASSFRPALIESSAIGAALLGDKGVVEELIVLLGAAESFSSQASITRALGRVGDARAIDPLLRLLLNPSRTDQARAVSAAALGDVCEKDPLPWRTVYSVGANYLAAPPTLTGNLGILDYR